MIHNIKILPSQLHFECNADETILSAALRANIILPYGCKDGVCGSCKVELLEGQVDYGSYQLRALSKEERIQGKILTCCAKPLGSIAFKAREMTGFGDKPVKRMPCRLKRIEKPAHDVAARLRVERHISHCGHRRRGRQTVERRANKSRRIGGRYPHERRVDSGRRFTTERHAKLIVRRVPGDARISSET